jgi:pimeloyl-ACP methyl ester carboxylesterase
MADVLRAPLRAKGYVDGLGGWLPLFLFAPEGGPSLQPDAYARLTMPTLLIWGDKDRTTPLIQGEALATLVPGVRLEVLPGIGHMPQLEATGRVQALLAEHLAPPP